MADMLEPKLTLTVVLAAGTRTEANNNNDAAIPETGIARNTSIRGKVVGVFMVSVNLVLSDGWFLTMQTAMQAAMQAAMQTPGLVLSFGEAELYQCLCQPTSHEN